MAVTVTPATATLYAGDRLQLVGTTTGSAIVWSLSDSTDTSVTVSSTGLVSCLVGKGVNAVTIIATSDAGINTCTLTTYGISTSYVASKIGRASSDVGTLCGYEGINLWSCIKPVVNVSTSGPIDVWNSGNFYKFNADELLSGGLDVTEIQGNIPLSTVLSRVDGVNNNYVYVHPTGNASSPISPYRLGDFRGYTITKPKSYLTTNPNSPSIKNIKYDNSTLLEEIIYTNWDTLITQHPDKTLRFSDIWFDNTGTSKLSDHYVTLILNKSGDNFYIKSLFKLSDVISTTNFDEINTVLDFLSIHDYGNKTTNTFTRRYVLTRDQVNLANPRVLSTLTGAYLSALNNSTGYHVSLSPGRYIPIITTESKLFSVTNSVITKVYQFLDIINNTANSYDLKVGLLPTTITDPLLIAWQKNAVNEIEIYNVGQGSFLTGTFAVNNIVAGAAYHMYMTLSSTDNPILYLYEDGNFLGITKFSEIGGRTYNGVTGHMWRYGDSNDGTIITYGGTMGGEKVLQLQVGAPLNFMTIYSEPRSGLPSSSFALNVSFLNTSFSEIDHTIETNGDFLRFEIPTDGTSWTITATGGSGDYGNITYEGIDVTSDPALHDVLTLVTQTPITLVLECVEIFNPLSKPEHELTIIANTV